MTLLLVALGAAIGAPVRFLVASWLDRAVPVGTLAVNVVGSFLLGLFVALSLGGDTYAVLGTGLCGGLTTYSAFAVQSVQLGRGRTSVVYVVVTVIGAIAAAALGFAIGA